MTGTLLSATQKYGDRYRVQQFIGEGGMQEVYAAVDETLGRRIALKVPKKSSAVRRFQRSAILSAKVNHPNVAKTLDYFEDERRFYLVEELVDGMSLSDFRAHIVRVDPYSCAHLLHHLAKGIAASHHVGVVHRDLKPSNIMVDGDFALNTIKITDFGIAKMAEQEMAEAAVSEESITSSNTMMGALPYLSPEMIKKPKDAGLPADIWAAGAIAYELMTGMKPFGAGLTAVPAILSNPVPPLPTDGWLKAQFQPLASEIYSVIKDCLDKDAGSRPTADDLVAACESFCYQTATRHMGNVQKIMYSSWGFIQPKVGSEPIFFHVESVYGQLPKSGDAVWFAQFAGDPRHRAHPVVPMNSGAAP